VLRSAFILVFLIVRMHLTSTKTLCFPGNGKCKADGKCECDAGYGRLDCSLAPPNLMPLIISGGVLGFIIVTALSVLPALVAYSAREVVTNALFRFAMFSSSGEWLGSSASASAGHKSAWPSFSLHPFSLICCIPLTKTHAFAECDNEGMLTAAVVPKGSETPHNCERRHLSPKRKALKMCEVAKLSNRLSEARRKRRIFFS
jgi:hypothetical protein